MKKIIAGVVLAAAVMAGTAGTAMANDGHRDDRGPHHRVGVIHHPHPIHHKLTWWEKLRLRLFHHL